MAICLVLFSLSNAVAGEEGKTFINVERYKGKTIGELDDAVSKKGDVDAYMQRGIFRFNESNYRDSFSDFSKVIEKDPTVLDAYFFCAKSLIMGERQFYFFLSGSV
jgi:hypothetical protein